MWGQFCEIYSPNAENNEDQTPAEESNFNHKLNKSNLLEKSFLFLIFIWLLPGVMVMSLIHKKNHIKEMRNILIRQ